MVVPIARRRRPGRSVWSVGLSGRIFALWLAECALFCGAAAQEPEVPEQTPGPAKHAERVSRLQGTAYFDRNEALMAPRLTKPR